ncbi:Gluconate transport-inducing protein [Lecanicillium sp. MT-2017a]|nr:Gluconate transport-inducing protein [Lecanicillium sp. MT-2017a]
METYHGYVRTPADAIKLFEACRLGLLPRVQRRLSEKERQSIRSGSVFVWDEREAGMRRWTDGKSWSASRVSGSFLTYREMEGKRGGGFGTSRRGNGKSPESGRNSDEDMDDNEPEGYRYKADGLMKQSFSITTSTGQHLHLISYYSRPQPGQPELVQPTNDPALRGIVPVKGMYPESSMGETNQTPALTRAPMQQPPPPHYMIAPQHPHHQPPYAPQYAQPGYGWPPSPAATPPYGHYTTAPYPPNGHALPPPQGAHPQAYPHPHGAPPPHPAYSTPQYTPAQYDRALPPLHSTPKPMHSSHGHPSGRPSPPHSHDSLPLRDVHAPQAKGGPLPALNSFAKGSPPQVGAGTPPTRNASVSPPRTSHSHDMPNLNGHRPSLTNILHHQPTPASSEAGGSGSGSSSPTRNNSIMSVDKILSGGSEDARALRMLDRKFCI